MTADGHWRVEHDGGVLFASLSHPPRNLLTFSVLAELAGVVAGAGTDPGVRVVVLRSDVDGRFITHADLDELASLAEGPVPEARHWYSTLRAVERSTVPIVGGVDGQAWGGGVELLLCCTMRVASHRAHFSLPETSLGIIPGAGGTQRLPLLVGPGRAADMILTGRVLHADEAYRIGLIDRILPGPDFTAALAQLAGHIASRPRDALIAAKRSIDEALGRPSIEGLRAEGAQFAALLASEESRRLQRFARDRYSAAEPSEDVALDDLPSLP